MEPPEDNCFHCGKTFSSVKKRDRQAMKFLFSTEDEYYKFFDMDEGRKINLAESYLCPSCFQRVKHMTSPHLQFAVSLDKQRKLKTLPGTDQLITMSTVEASRRQYPDLYFEHNYASVHPDHEPMVLNRYPPGPYNMDSFCFNCGNPFKKRKGQGKGHRYEKYLRRLLDLKDCKGVFQLESDLTAVQKEKFIEARVCPRCVKVVRAVKRSVKETITANSRICDGEDTVTCAEIPSEDIHDGSPTGLVRNRKEVTDTGGAQPVVAEVLNRKVCRAGKIHWNVNRYRRWQHGKTFIKGIKAHQKSGGHYPETPTEIKESDKDQLHLRQRATKYLLNSQYGTMFRLLFKKSAAARKTFQILCRQQLRAEIDKLLGVDSVFSREVTNDSITWFSLEEAGLAAKEVSPFLTDILKALLPNPQKLFKRREYKSEKAALADQVATMYSRVGLILGLILYANKPSKFQFIPSSLGVKLWQEGTAPKCMHWLHDIGLTSSHDRIKMRAKKLEEDRLTEPTPCEPAALDNESSSSNISGADLMRVLEEGPFQCSDCDRSYQLKLGLKRHRISQHPPKPIKREVKRPYKCKACGRAFGAMGNVLNHNCKPSVQKQTVQTSAVDAPLTFGKLGKLRCRTGHKWTRGVLNGTRPLQAPTSRPGPSTGGTGNASTAQNKFKLLFVPKINYHHRGKDLPCRQCSKIFSDPSSRKRHIRKVHAPNRSFVCEFCERTFSLDSLLQKHLNSCRRRIQSQEPPKQGSQGKKTTKLKKNRPAPVGNLSNLHGGDQLTQPNVNSSKALPKVRVQQKKKRQPVDGSFPGNAGTSHVVSLDEASTSETILRHEAFTPQTTFQSDQQEQDVAREQEVVQHVQCSQGKKVKKSKKKKGGAPDSDPHNLQSDEQLSQSDTRLTKNRARKRKRPPRTLASSQTASLVKKQKKTSKTCKAGSTERNPGGETDQIRPENSHKESSNQENDARTVDQPGESLNGESSISTEGETFRNSHDILSQLEHLSEPSNYLVAVPIGLATEEDCGTPDEAIDWSTLMNLAQLRTDEEMLSINHLFNSSTDKLPH